MEKRVSMQERFRRFLIAEEKSPATVEKYLRDVRQFYAFLGEEKISKERAIAYKAALRETHAPATVNAAIASLNRFFTFLGHADWHIKSLKLQKSTFAPVERELTKAEYERLIQAAKRRGGERLALLMQAICATGIRVSELRFITREAACRHYADVNNKGKLRRVFIPKALCRALLDYSREKKIKSGPLFVTRSGKPLHRGNIWADMKGLCPAAGVAKGKVFPHNLRHLFARTFYTTQKDIVRLADILGHASINTTRIYTRETGEIHERKIQNLGLFLC